MEEDNGSYYPTILSAIHSLETTEEITPELADKFRKIFNRYLVTKNGKKRVELYEATCKFRVIKISKSIPSGAECFQVTGIILEAIDLNDEGSTAARITIEIDPKHSMSIERR